MPPVAPMSWGRQTCNACSVWEGSESLYSCSLDSQRKLWAERSGPWSGSLVFFKEECIGPSGEEHSQAERTSWIKVWSYTKEKTSVMWLKLRVCVEGVGVGGKVRNAGAMRASYLVSGGEPLKDFNHLHKIIRKVFKDESYEEDCLWGGSLGRNIHLDPTFWDRVWGLWPWVQAEGWSLCHPLKRRKRRTGVWWSFDTCNLD